MGSAIDEEMRGVSWEAWRGLLGVDGCTDTDRNAAANSDLCEWDIRVGLERFIPTIWGSRWLSRLVKLSDDLRPRCARALAVLPVPEDAGLTGLFTDARNFRLRDVTELHVLHLAKWEWMDWVDHETRKPQKGWSVTPLGRAVLWVQGQKSAAATIAENTSSADRNTAP